ncbi:hypothetical protein [Cryobacterium roopkundense]|uniref:ABC transporter domain-containing protein n=1 Tax=Cryobacterium roopkundense TaxID=1001240 RepID=A0A7W8ZWM3_9MICO|nr:hypothetical protein [Cryobacterium roopkundense]MBB5641325.1 hypothetical protein [Cryobacterium roopkundense]
MRVILTSVTKGSHDSSLPPTSLEFASGTVTLARAETERRPTVLGLIASGRMRADRGAVTIDGVSDYSEMRNRIALVDAPGVCEPADDVTVARVVAEELMFAGRSSSRASVLSVLDSLELRDVSRSALADLAPSRRIRLLTELAVVREGVEALVVCSPDRHGGDPLEWWTLLEGLATRGYAVLAIAGDASAHAIGGLLREGADAR